MVRILEAGNGQIAGICVAEVLSVPYYQLLAQDQDRANHSIQTVFSQLVSGFHRQMVQDEMSVELLFQSCSAENQTYDAQVKMFVLFRMVSARFSRWDITNTLEQLMNHFRSSLAVVNYELKVLESDVDYDQFQNSLTSTLYTTVNAVAKKEMIFSTPYGAQFYCNEVVEPSEQVNPSALMNAMTQHPNSLVLLQLIPTTCTPQERQMLEMQKTSASYMSGQMRFVTGPRLDPNMKRVMDFYESATQACQDPMFYYNFMVFSSSSGSSVLGSRIIDQIETDAIKRGSAFELLDVSAQIPNPGQTLMISPWLYSNLLVYKAREAVFWQSQYAPVQLQRFRYLMTARDLKGVFKLPIDDGTTIGLESRRTQSTREKLNQGVLGKGSFRMGYLRNVERSDGIAEAGIPLNDFTKHGLIVGMPGSGKTNFSLGLLLQFWRVFHIPFLAIEPTKNEYRSLVDAIPELQIFTPGKGDISPFVINPFIPPDNVTVETYTPALMTAFRSAFTMPSPLPNVFQNAINEAYTHYGWRKRSTSSDPDVQFFGMYEFIRVFKEVASNLGYKGESKANIESAGVLRLVSLIEQNSNIYDSVHTIPLPDLLSRPTVVELNAITDKEQKSLLMSFLLTLVCVHTKNNMDSDGVLKNILLMDEAHVLLGRGGSPEDSSRNATIDAVEDMIAELRSFGTGIIIADQTPTAIGRSIVANTNVKMVFKLVDKESRDVISSATNMSKNEYEELVRMGVGQAMLHFGRINTPLHISTYDVNQIASIRQVIPDNEAAKLCTYWNEPGHQKLLIPHRACSYCSTCQEQCDLDLRDQADYIAARILQEYPGKLADIKTFCGFLVQLNPLIRRIAATRGSLTLSSRLLNCVKVKYLHKALLIVPFRLQERQLVTILKHSKFLNYEG